MIDRQKMRGGFYSGKIFKKICSGKKPKRHWDTLEEVEVKKVCVFCGKTLSLNVGRKHKMHREIECESTLVGQETTYENIEINIPCCQECFDLNSLAEKRADKKALVVGSVVAVAGLAGLLYFSWVNGDIIDKSLGIAIIMFFVWAFLFAFFRWMFRPVFEKRICECDIVSAMFEKG